MTREEALPKEQALDEIYDKVRKLPKVRISIDGTEQRAGSEVTTVFLSDVLKIIGNYVR